VLNISVKQSRPVEVDVTKKGWLCERCGHEWIPKVKGFAPAVCPKCKSPYWNRPRQSAKPAPPAKPGLTKKSNPTRPSSRRVKT